jgi:outer membrane protein
MRSSLLLAFCLIFTTISFCQTKQIKIGFLLDKNSIEIEGLLEELSNEISSVVGEDAILEFPDSSMLVNNFDSKIALSNYNTLLQNATDIIIAFGIVNNTVISKIGTYPKPTIVFGTLSEELLANSIPIAAHKNYTSIITSQSYTEDLKVLQQLVKPKRVGVVIEFLKL